MADTGDLALGILLGAIIIGVPLAIVIFWLLQKKEDQGVIFERDEQGRIVAIYSVPAIRK